MKHRVLVWRLYTKGWFVGDGQEITVTSMSSITMNIFIKLIIFNVQYLHYNVVEWKCYWYLSKVKLSLCFNWKSCHEDVLGNGGVAPHILDLGSRWRWVVSFTPRPLNPRERAPFTHWIGGWVGPGAGLVALVKKKIPDPCWVSNTRSSSP
jgi:hypothetical protein